MSSPAGVRPVAVASAPDFLITPDAAEERTVRRSAPHSGAPRSYFSEAAVKQESDPAIRSFLIRLWPNSGWIPLDPGTSSYPERNDHILALPRALSASRFLEQTDQILASGACLPHGDSHLAQSENRSRGPGCSAQIRSARSENRSAPCFVLCSGAQRMLRSQTANVVARLQRFPCAAHLRARNAYEHKVSALKVPLLRSDRDARIFRSSACAE